MNAETYLQQLRIELKSFSAEEQERLLEEIKSHIESGEEDLTMGKTRAERQQRVMGEIGSPQKMGRGFHDIYRPSKWAEFLWGIVVPTTIGWVVTWVLNALMQKGLIGNSSNSAVPLACLMLGIGLACLLLAVLRHSTLLTLYWLPRVVLNLGEFFVLSQISFTDYHFPSWSVILAGLLAAGLAIWAIRLFYTIRQDLLLVTFFLLPVLGLLTNFLGRIVLNFSRMSSTLPLMMGNAWGVITLIIPILSLAWTGIFFLSDKRNTRWGGLLLVAMTSHLAKSMAFSLIFYGLEPFSLAATVISPLLIGASWWLDRRKNRLATIA